ncbi:MAG: endonuclease/exonuclease/phosphatase family protein, partial [Pseudomonadota bacterium]
MGATKIVWHANVHGVRPRQEELQAATSGYTVLSLQETGFRSEEEQRSTYLRLWPDHCLVATFLQDEGGVGCALLVHRQEHWRGAFQFSARRHRLLGVDVRIGSRWLRVAALYVPPVASGFQLDVQLLADGLGSPLAVLVGDLNARSVDLGCRSTNAHGRALADFLLDGPEDGAVILNDPGQPTFLHNAADFCDTIDWVVATPRASQFLRADLGRDVGSDHWPLLVHTTSPVLERRRTSDVLRWRTSRLTRDQWTQFEDAAHSELSGAGLVPAPDPPASPADLDTAVLHLEAALQRAADSTVPRSRPRADSARLPLPWPLVLLIRERNRLRRRLAQHGPTPQLRLLLAEVRKDLRHQLDSHRRQQLQEKTTAFSAGPKREGLQFWTRVRQWFRGAPAVQPPLDVSPGPAVSPRERATAFAAHLQQALGGLSDASFEEDFRRDT